ncbi:polysaccharide biosynthesis/export family protein [Granulicella arctica]|uniref:Polysaccharide export outer membrane protein n=1 Tax=Granulicella arctica TaxID=940613 RepID=A0A7Y9TUI3_9BACT|nr:polysaccharide biosynthesis/export family protein [Granulicella arctica]NYF80893.1 polysaccharide export outer membrane protein [Granulicella arctica]
MSLRMAAMNKIKEAPEMGMRCAALLLLLCGFGASACGQFSGPSLSSGTPSNAPLTPTTDPAILYPVDRPLQIGAGDSLTIHLFGAPEFAHPQLVAQDGSLQVPLIGAVPVAGLSLYQASEKIAAQLKSAGMYKNPQVSLELILSPNQVVTITGEMHGLIPVFGERSLLSVLSSAGAYPPTASHTIIINRPGIPDPIVVDLGTDPSHSARADIPVFPRDTVVVPRVGVIYLLGAFKTQMAIPLEQNSPLTLMQAAALGGGVLFEGKYKDLRIIRTVGFERKVVKLDVKQVFKGKVPDPVLQADDIVYLPSSTVKAALNDGGFAAITSVASLLLTAFQYQLR